MGYLLLLLQITKSVGFWFIKGKRNVQIFSNSYIAKQIQRSKIVQQTTTKWAGLQQKIAANQANNSKIPKPQQDKKKQQRITKAAGQHTKQAKPVAKLPSKVA